MCNSSSVATNMHVAPNMAEEFPLFYPSMRDIDSVANNMLVAALVVAAAFPLCFFSMCDANLVVSDLLVAPVVAADLS
jgi:hypothetical protein